jgi:serine/threonine-protein kinase
MLGGRFRVEREIGRGGMATVYLAEDVRHRRRVALKVLLPDLAESLGADRFRREIAVVASLTHPHILPLYDSSADTIDGPPFFVMPFVEGETLRERMTRERLSLADAVRITIEVAEALDHAHRRGIVHRDVKPENILILEGHAVVTDFGIAHAVREAGGDRLTQTGILLGTPRYMSPEQVDGVRVIDGRSDIFSLGIVLYELLTGENPFVSASVTSTLSRIATVMPESPRIRRPDVSETLASIVLATLAKDPGERPVTGATLAAALRATPEASGIARRAPRRSRIAIVGAATVLVAAPLVFALFNRRTAAPAELPSIAVLPFANESGDSADAYVGSGIAEELLNALADVPNIRVASRTSSFALRANTSVADIGQRLNVGSVLEGSVRRANGTIRVSARLIDTRRDAEVWSASMNGPAADVFEVQEQIARAIVAKLRVRLAGTGAIVRRGTRNPDAYDLVLRAKALRARGEDGLLPAKELLERAIALDSTYAEAYADLTLVYERIGIFHQQEQLRGESGMTPREALRRAHLAAERAIQLDNTSADAHVALGTLAFRYEWDWPRAISELRQALTLNPTSVSAYSEFARIERSLGRFAHARLLLDSAHYYSAGAEPADGRLGYGRIAFFAGDFATAIRESTDSDATATPALRMTWLAQAYVGAKQYAAAESLLVSPRAAPDPGSLLTLALVMARTGRRDGALAIISRARRAPVNDLPTTMAAVYVALGDTARALAEINRAVDIGDPLVVDLAVNPFLDPLRENTDFKQIIARLRFPAVERGRSGRPNG